MNFQFEISGTLIKETPLEFSEWTERVVYDRARATLLIELPNEHTFAGDGYAFIKGKYDELGFNSAIDVTIRKQDSSVSPWAVVTEGQIPLTSCEFNFKQATVTVRITDQTYNSKIRVNSSAGVYVFNPKSKNGVDILSYVPTNLNMSLHNQGTGAYTTGYYAYDLLEVLEHCARWMSDGEIGVVSNWYDGLSLDFGTSAVSDLHKIAIMSGEEIKQVGSDIPPVISWDTLTEFTSRALGLVASVEVNSDGNTQIRFEPEEDTEGTEIASISNVSEVVRGINTQLIYSDVRVGSRHYIKDEGADDGYPLPLVPGMTHGEEDMYLEGTANVGRTKDLTTEICTDTNAIYDLFQLGDHEDFDDRVFAIEYAEDKGTNKSMRGQWFSSNYLYNRNLITGEIVKRHRWTSNVLTKYGNDDDTFLAILTDGTYELNNLSSTSGLISVQPFKFDNDYSGGEIEAYNGTATVEDVNNNWGNGTVQGVPVTAANSRYTCPSAGFYFFAGLILMDVSRSQTEKLLLNVRVGFKRYNSGGSLQQTYEATAQDITFEEGAGSTTYPLRFSVEDIVFAKQNDYIEFYFDMNYLYPNAGSISPTYDSINFTALESFSDPQQWTYFQCLATENGGGIVAGGSVDSYPAETDSFDVPMSYSTWIDIKNNLTSGIKYTGQGIGNETGWIEDISYNHRTARATVRLRRKFNTK